MKQLKILLLGLDARFNLNALNIFSNYQATNYKNILMNNNKSTENSKYFPITIIYKPLNMGNDDQLCLIGKYYPDISTYHIFFIGRYGRE